MLDIDPEVKTRKAPRRRQEKASTGEADQVEEMREEDFNKQENETTKNVRQIHRILEHVGPINMFNFFINPESFSQSVENLFYLSFLIRDGKAYIDDDSGQPILGKIDN